MAYPFFCLISPLPLFLGLGLRLGPGGPPLFLDRKNFFGGGCLPPPPAPPSSPYLKVWIRH